MVGQNKVIRWYRGSRFIVFSEIHYRPARYDKTRRHRVVATRTTTCITRNRVTDTARRRSDRSVIAVSATP